MADSPDYDVQPPPLQVEGALSSHDLAIRDLIDWDYEAMTFEARVLLDERKDYGLGKYGVVLHKDNGRDHPRDALDEALDLVVYLRTWLDAKPELGDLIRPLYQRGQTMLVILANWHANQREPAMVRPMPAAPDFWGTVPSLHPGNVPSDELSAVDRGTVMYWPESPENEAGIACGGLQRDGDMCTRPVTEVLGGLECPRHGARRRS